LYLLLVSFDINALFLSFLFQALVRDEGCELGLADELSRLLDVCQRRNKSFLDHLHGAAED